MRHAVPPLRRSQVAIVVESEEVRDVPRQHQKTVVESIPPRVAQHEADHVMAEALLHVLSRLELRNRNELCGPYIHTKRNKLPDLGSGRFAPEATSRR